jgi:hypothetical protein
MPAEHPQPTGFRPGVRFSLLDGLVLVAAMAGTAWLLPHSFEAAFLVGFVVGHFFLFCNVFRIGRLPELVWAGGFVLLTANTLLTGVPSLVTTAALALLLAAILIGREMRLPRYHGLGWRRLNPGLPEWWKKRQNRSPSPSGLSESG